MIPTRFYHCGRCKENFWLRESQPVHCPACGNMQVSEKSLVLDLNNKSMTLNNVVHGVKDTGVIRINIKGERKKALFLCEDCAISFEADCTEGLHTVSCPRCKKKNISIKSPIASVIAGVKGVPLPKTHWTKAEIKLARFAKECYKKYVEFESRCKALVSLAHALELPENMINNIDNTLKHACDLLKEKIDKKIENYGKRVELD